MIVPCNDEGIRKASEIVKKGGVVVFPTDTVYGLGCDPRNSEAVQTIYKIKGRDKSKHLPVLGESAAEICKIAFLDELSTKIVDKFWPGPLTLILEVKDSQIARSLNLTGKIAVRVPNHPCTLSLLKQCKLLVGTSANRSGEDPFEDANEISVKLKGYDIILDGGKIVNSSGSTIIEVNDNRLEIIRAGEISKKEILALL